MVVRLKLKHSLWQGPRCTSKSRHNQSGHICYLRAFAALASTLACFLAAFSSSLARSFSSLTRFFSCLLASASASLAAFAAFCSARLAAAAACSSGDWGGRSPYTPRRPSKKLGFGAGFSSDAAGA